MSRLVGADAVVDPLVAGHEHDAVFRAYGRCEAPEAASALVEARAILPVDLRQARELLFVADHREPHFFGEDRLSHLLVREHLREKPAVPDDRGIFDLVTRADDDSSARGG